MDPTNWPTTLRALYDQALALYVSGRRGADTYFTPTELAFLTSIGLQPINVYDFAEDFSRGGEPDWDTFLRLATLRREYLLTVQHGHPAPDQPFDLPERKAELGGIPWLPRITYKAQCFLEGRLRPDVMYCCGGDRNFLKRHNIHAADFLRAVWDSHGDNEKVLAFVREAPTKQSCHQAS